MRILRLTVLATAVLLCGTVHAGQACDATPLTPRQARNALELAQRTATALERSGAQVAILGRAGQDLSAYGLRYSHLGIAYREAGSDGEQDHAANNVPVSEQEVGRLAALVFFEHPEQVTGDAIKHERRGDDHRRVRLGR